VGGTPIFSKTYASILDENLRTSAALQVHLAYTGGYKDAKSCSLIGSGLAWSETTGFYFSPRSPMADEGVEGTQLADRPRGSSERQRAG
jgi:hypothetical protein